MRKDARQPAHVRAKAERWDAPMGDNNDAGKVVAISTAGFDAKGPA